MQPILSQFPQLYNLNPGLAIILLLIGLIYGVFGWRIMRYLVLADSVGLAILISVAVREMSGNQGLFAPWVLLAVLLIGGLPWLAWRFPDQSTIGLCGFVGFLSTELFMMCFDFPSMAQLLIGILVAGLAMALCSTLWRQTAVVVTGMHGAWLCVAAMLILSSHTEHYAGRLIDSLNSSYSFIVPGAAIVFSIIMIALQWAGLEQETVAV